MINSLFGLLCLFAPLAQAEIPVPEAANIPLRETFHDVNACWQRAEHPVADALGLPLRVCIRRVGVIVDAQFGLPFNVLGRLIVEGTPVSGWFHVAGGARMDDGWNIVSSVYSSKVDAPCGQLSYGFTSVSADIDTQGRILPNDPTIRGVLFDAAPLCAKPAKVVELYYTRVP